MADIAVLSGGVGSVGMSCCGVSGVVDPPFPGDYGYHGAGLCGLGALASAGQIPVTPLPPGGSSPGGGDGGFWGFIERGPGQISDWLCAFGIGGERCRPQGNPGGFPSGAFPSGGIGVGTVALVAAAGIAAVLVLRK